jgi:PqqD family protein of HPr-rel-A system
VFQKAANKTHFLNEASALILDLLAEGPARFSAILDMLSEDLDDSQAARLMTHLDRLEQLGLVERRRFPNADADR